MSRGLKISNPGNIRCSNQQWLGKITPSRDPDFETFQNVEYGIRAAAVIVLNYFREHGLNTITGIINRWAPPTENNTTAYIRDVCDRTGYNADAQLDLEDEDDLLAVVHALCDHEQGSAIDAVTPEQFQAGVAMALATVHA